MHFKLANRQNSACKNYKAYILVRLVNGFSQLFLPFTIIFLSIFYISYRNLFVILHFNI